MIQQERPDFIFYLCGVDILATDKLGTLGLTVAGCKERDAFVLETCHQTENSRTVQHGWGLFYRD